MENLINVHYYNGKDLVKSKNLSWPQDYDAFIKDIKQNFDLNPQNIEIILKLVTDDEDENNIKSQDELEDFITENNIKEFKFHIEEKEVKDERKIEGKGDFAGLEKLLDPNLLKEEEELNIDDIMADIFKPDEYKKRWKKIKLNIQIYLIKI